MQKRITALAALLAAPYCPMVWLLPTQATAMAGVTSAANHVVVHATTAAGLVTELTSKLCQAYAQGLISTVTLAFKLVAVALVAMPARDFPAGGALFKNAISFGVYRN
jgi:hypothetical protein